MCENAVDQTLECDCDMGERIEVTWKCCLDWRERETALYELTFLVYLTKCDFISFHFV